MSHYSAKSLFIICLMGYNINIIYGFLFPIMDPSRLYIYNPPENEVEFYLYDKLNVSKNFQIFIENKTLNHVPFELKKPTKIIIHGWTHGKDTPWVKEMAKVLAKIGFWNIIVVDWSKLSRVIYVEARVHNLVVAKQVYKLLKLLYSIKYPMSNIHIIGHSMGAQISATAANKMNLESEERIGRITGLDPAAPLYEWPHIESLDEVLDPKDATFVDAIHTNAGRIGMITPAGHVDYYPNGGDHQWGCNLWACSHIRACEFFIASIRKPDLFKAFSYESWIKYINNSTDGHLEAYPMGLSASPQIPNGIYFLQVEDEYTEYAFSTTTFLDSYGTYFGFGQLNDIIQP